jgi:hypothetical protein
MRGKVELRSGGNAESVSTWKVERMVLIETAEQLDEIAGGGFGDGERTNAFHGQ